MKAWLDSGKRSGRGGVLEGKEGGVGGVGGVGRKVWGVLEGWCEGGEVVKKAVVKGMGREFFAEPYIHDQISSSAIYPRISTDKNEKLKKLMKNSSIKNIIFTFFLFSGSKYTTKN